jgi:hypothetical protein
MKSPRLAPVALAVALGCCRSGQETQGARPEAGGGRSVVASPEFHIVFPGVPGPPDHSVKNTSWGKIDVTTWRLRATSGASYQLQRQESDSPLSEQGDVDRAFEAFEAQAHETPQRLVDRKVTIGACEGREVSARVSGLTLHGLLCVRASRAYMAQAVVPEPDARAASGTTSAAGEAEEFLRSFTIAR